MYTLYRQYLDRLSITLIVTYVCLLLRVFLCSGKTRIETAFLIVLLDILTEADLTERQREPQLIFKS